MCDQGADKDAPGTFRGSTQLVESQTGAERDSFEPLRYCYRQPLKLAEPLCVLELKRIRLTDVSQERAVASGSDDFIRTDSHTP